jgi:hypothetical protein
MLLKIFSTLFGYNYEVVKCQSTVSKQKIITLGTLMLIPVSLWTISGFYIGYNLLGASLVSSLIGGVFVGLLILIIDKSFLATPKESVSLWLKGFRIVFAVIATILGSIALDLMFFSGDLEEYRAKLSTAIQRDKTEEYLKNNNKQIAELTNSISQQKEIVEASKIDWKKEVDGSSGSGNVGIGKIALLKERIFRSDSTKLAHLEANLISTKENINKDAISYGQKMATKNSNALLSKITDLHDFILSSGLSTFFYGLFFFAVFSLEIFFLITKSSTADSLFEKMLYAEEKVGERRLHTMMSQREEILRQNGLLGSRADRIRHIASTNESFQIV